MGKLLSGLLIAQMVSAPLWPHSPKRWREMITSGSGKRTDVRCGVRIDRRRQRGVLGIGSFWIVPAWVSADLKPSILLAAGFALWGFITNVFAAVTSFMANNRFIRRLTLLTSMAALSSLVLKLSFARTLGVTWIIWATAIGYGAACVLGLRQSVPHCRGSRRGFRMPSEALSQCRCASTPVSGYGSQNGYALCECARCTHRFADIPALSEPDSASYRRTMTNGLMATDRAYFEHLTQEEAPDGLLPWSPTTCSPCARAEVSVRGAGWTWGAARAIC